MHYCLCVHNKSNMFVCGSKMYHVSKVESHTQTHACIADGYKTVESLLNTGKIVRIFFHVYIKYVCIQERKLVHMPLIRVCGFMFPFHFHV
jgi:hypothetical protein